MFTKNNKKKVFGRTKIHKHKLEKSRDKKEHSPSLPIFLGMGLAVVLLFVSVSIGVASATDWYAPVSDDHIQPLSFEVSDWPPYEELVSAFEFFHDKSEEIYNGDGSWGCGYCGAYGGAGHPLYRDTARRVLGYIDAYHVTGREIYKQRAKEGLDYLVKEQMDNGDWRWWYGPSGSTAPLYETSIPTTALVEGYKLFNDQKYLTAAGKGANHLSHQGNSGNANFNLFAVWALSSYYEVTGTQSYLDRAIGFGLYALRGQLSSGGWSDSHNQKIGYHAIITRGYVKLLSVMPKDHSKYTDIEKATYKAINHLKLRQTKDGLMLYTRSDTSSRYWDGRATQAISVAITQLNWPVEDSLHLTAKGIPSSGANNEVLAKYLLGIGSLMKAYTFLHADTGTISGTKETADFLRRCVLHAIKFQAQQSYRVLSDKLKRFKDLVIQDSMVIRLHASLAKMHIYSRPPPLHSSPTS